MSECALPPDLLSHAQTRLLRTRHSLEQLEAALAATFLPPQYWSRRVRRFLSFLELRYSRAQRDFYRAMSILAPASKPAAKSEAAKPEVQTPASPPPAKYGRLYHQSAEIKVVDGAAVTRIVDYQNDHWLSQSSFPEDSVFCRQLSFADRAIPDPYAEIMRRHGIALQPPPRALFLDYSEEEFLALCRREVESGAQHFTEGNPYSVRPLV